MVNFSQMKRGEKKIATQNGRRTCATTDGPNSGTIESKVNVKSKCSRTRSTNEMNEHITEMQMAAT